MSQKKGIREYFINSPSAVRVNWRKGEFLCREVGSLKQIHLLISGKFRVFRSLSNGRDMLYRIYLPGSVIGDIEVFTGGDSASCSVQCTNQAETIAMAISSISETPAEHAELLFLLGRGIARKLHENSISEALNTNYSLETRLAHYYLTFTDPALQAESLGQLSDWMGCSYRHLTRSLASLKKRNAIRSLDSKKGAAYTAGNKAVLAAIAEPILFEDTGKMLFEPGDN